MNKKIKKDLEYPLLCYDVVFKSIFSGNENILAKMISDITGVDYLILEDNITLEFNELPIERKKEKFKRCDFIVRYDKDNIINLELNRQSYAGILVKGLSYAFNIFSRNSIKGEKYNENLKITQININCFGNEIKPLSKYHIREEETNEVYSNNIIFYVLNVAKCHDIYYNKEEKEVPKYVKWGAFLTCDNIEDIPLITKGILTKEEIDIIMDKLNKLTNDVEFMSDLERLQWEEWERKSIEQDLINTSVKKGLEQGIKQGIKQGIEQKNTEIIQSMLKRKMSYEDISEITNKTIEEIKKIENSMKID